MRWEGINELIDLYDSPNQTGNRALDIVIAEKSRARRGRGTSMTCMADGRPAFFYGAVRYLFLIRKYYG